MAVAPIMSSVTVSYTHLDVYKRQAENRTGLELEFGVAVVVLYDDVGTRNVRGHEVGRKLNTRKGKTEHASQGTYQSRCV